MDCGISTALARMSGMPWRTMHTVHVRFWGPAMRIAGTMTETHDDLRGRVPSIGIGAVGQ